MNPSDAGVTDGGGVYCYGNLCTMTAHAFEDIWVERHFLLSGIMVKCTSINFPWMCRQFNIIVSIELMER